MRPADGALTALLAALLGSCNAPAASVPGGGKGSSLERTALEAGIVADSSKAEPEGLFQREHEGGRDSFCVLPMAGERYRFGMEIIFGAKESCRGHGTARRAGDKLILNFAGPSDCFVVAGFEGDRIAMPGVTDRKCAALCTNATLDGVSFPRLTSDEAAARAVFDREGKALCGS